MGQNVTCNVVLPVLFCTLWDGCNGVGGGGEKDRQRFTRNTTKTFVDLGCKLEIKPIETGSFVGLSVYVTKITRKVILVKKKKEEEEHKYRVNFLCIFSFIYLSSRMLHFPGLAVASSPVALADRDRSSRVESQIQVDLRSGELTHLGRRGLERCIVEKHALGRQPHR